MKYVDRQDRAGRFLFRAAGGIVNHRAHLLNLFFIGDREADGLEARYLRDHVRVDRRDYVELVGPGVAIMRPREVAREMLPPLRGHPVAREQAAMLRWDIGHGYER